LLAGLLTGLLAEGEALERREKRRMSAAAESELGGPDWPPFNSQDDSWAR
jgi:hypothetical protein